jgi:two-component system, cell cycle response regulator DivK
MQKILIVDDNKENRDMLSRRLSRAGYDICLAMDGPSGVQTAFEQMPDVILMDIALGAMDGWEATEILKADARTAAIPIIALTAHDSPKDAAISLAVGCADHDTKPVDLPRLLGKIEAQLKPAQPT